MGKIERLFQNPTCCLCGGRSKYRVGKSGYCHEHEQIAFAHRRACQPRVDSVKNRDKFAMKRRKAGLPGLETIPFNPLAELLRQRLHLKDSNRRKG